MTSAAAHPEGSAIHLSPTAKMFSDIESTFGDFWDAGTQELTADVNNTNTTTQTLEAETANIGGSPTGISLDQSTFENITEHTGQLVEVSGSATETIFSVSDPVDVIVGKINGEQIGRVKLTWPDDSSDDIYIGRTQGRNANDFTFNTISIGSIRNVKELSFQVGATNDYGWRVLTV